MGIPRALSRVVDQAKDLGPKLSRDGLPNVVWVAHFAFERPSIDSA
jgi:hypothetical protein